MKQYKDPFDRSQERAVNYFYATVVVAIIVGVLILLGIIE